MRRLAQYFFLPVLASTAILVNRTIDDQHGDSVTGALPSYTPGHWAYGPECSGCSIYPGNIGHTGYDSAGAAVDVSKTYGSSWHDTTYMQKGPNITVSMTFVGQAVYVYNIIANVIPNVTTLTDLIFTLNGTVVGRYTHKPDPSGPVLMYQVPVYVNTSLSHGTHTLTISTRGTQSSLILFDYITYTVDDKSEVVPPSSTRVHGPLPPATTSTSLARSNVSTATSLARSDVSTASVVSDPSPSAANKTQEDLHVLKSPAFVAGVVAGSVLGVLLVIAFLHAWRKRTQRARALELSTLFTETSKAESQRSSLSAGSRLSPLVPGFSTQASDNFSTAATAPASRFAQSSPDNPPTTPVSATGRHAARLRLFQKITTSSRPSRADHEGPHAEHEIEDASPPPPPPPPPPPHARPRRIGLRRLLVEMAALRKQVAELAAATAHELPSEPAPPPYESAKRVPSNSETQADLVAQS